MKIKLGLVSECVWPRTDPLILRQSDVRAPAMANARATFCNPSSAAQVAT